MIGLISLRSNAGNLRLCFFACVKSRFSHDMDAIKLVRCLFVNEPQHEKTCLRGFQPGPTKTSLFNHRRWLDACNFGFRK